MRRLLLAEKFSAALRLARILSDGTAKKVRADGASYFTFSSGDAEVLVVPLRGHVVEIDYPEEVRDWKSVPPDRLIDLEPVRIETHPAVHEVLRQLAPTLDEVVLATDYDREGELIGIEALETLRSAHPTLPAKRARFSAMAPWEIRRAFEALTEPDWNLAHAAAARQKIDLAWGAVLTRFLTLRCDLGGRLLSVGRVQTPTLGLVAERERAREDFVPRTFWDVTAEIEDPVFQATAVGGPFWDRGGAEAAAALASLGSQAVVRSVETRDERDHPPAPFNTTSFLAEASRLRLSAARAMAIAQRLYERGEISYPRTDNTVYPGSLDPRAILERLRESAHREVVEAILAQPEIRPSRGPVHTTDHPPIHPTALPAKAHRGPEGTVYDLIVRRFLATLMPPSVRRVTAVRLDVGDASFRAEASRVVEPGWCVLFPESDSTDPDLSGLQDGATLAVRAVRLQDGQTRPPPFHSQASLLISMERLGLGTKSTRHEILDLLFRRRYIEGRALRTTAAGRALVDALSLYAPDFVSPEMTRRLEERMDAIAEGRAAIDEAVTESRGALRHVLQELRAHEVSLARWMRGADSLEQDFGPCTACGKGRLVRRRTKTGWAFLGCSEFPRCKNRARLGRSSGRVPWEIPREAPLTPA